MDDSRKNYDGSWIAGSQLWGWKFIHGYSLMIFLGVLASCLTIIYFWRRYKYSWEILQILMIITIPTAIIGSRFYTLIFDGGWHQWYRFSGLSIYGALIFSIPTGCVYIWTKRHAVDFRTVVSIVVPTILIGQAIGRWGNFLNHEIYGEVVSEKSLEWTTFIKKQMYIDGHYRAPIFLYESIASGIGYFIIVWVINRKSFLKPGASGGVYALWYGTERLILQLFRDPSQASWLDDNKEIPLNLVVSVLFIIAGTFFLVWFQFLTRPFSKLTIRIGKYSRTISLVPLPQAIQNHFKKEYQVIFPIKPRRIFFIGKLVKTKKQYLYFFGKNVPNKIKLYIPIPNQKKWSKREINRDQKG